MKNINRCIKPRVTDFNICPTLIDCIKSSFSAYFKLAWKMWLIRLSNAKKTDKKTKQKKMPHRMICTVWTNNAYNLIQLLCSKEQ